MDLESKVNLGDRAFGGEDLLAFVGREGLKFQLYLLVQKSLMARRSVVFTPDNIINRRHWIE
jgi:hypothetical protein